MDGPAKGTRQHCPAQICSSIAEEVRELRRKGGEPNANLDRMIGQLWEAPVDGPADVLALAALSRKLLAASLGDITPDDLADMDNPRGLSICANLFIQRIVESLEAHTGLSAEGFTGDATTLN